MTHVTAEEFAQFNRDAVVRHQKERAEREEQARLRAIWLAQACPGCGQFAGAEKYERSGVRCKRCALIAYDETTLLGVGVSAPAAKEVATKMFDAGLVFRDW